MDLLIYVSIPALHATEEDPPTKSKPATTLEMSEADRMKLGNIGEGYSLMQKGLFLFVILACVAVYLRMTSKKQKRYPEKSMV